MIAGAANETAVMANAVTQTIQDLRVSIVSGRDAEEATIEEMVI